MQYSGTRVQLKHFPIVIFILVLLCISQNLFGQQNEQRVFTTPGEGLFDSEEVLSLQLSYSNKEVRTKTNDSTYLKTTLKFKNSDEDWQSIEVAIRARGNFRKDHCYFTPLKIKIAKTEAAGTPFQEEKKLKLVVPCFNGKDMNDKIVKEYMAYQLYEELSPFHFKTRLVEIQFSEIRSNKIKAHKLLGFLIEDVKKVAKRHDGRVLKRHMRALAQEATTSVRNNIFHFMIGNTDYSTTYQHNQKLLFIDKKMIPMPFDFDMSGLVNAHYAVVSNVQNLQLNIDDVTERMYKGFKRDPAVFEAVRIEYLEKKETILDKAASLRKHFRSKKEYDTARNFLKAFFRILESDKQFKADIIAMARDK